MAKSKEQIIGDITKHIQTRGGSYRDWYVGIGSDARDRLFTTHEVRQKTDRWILRRADSPEAAREVAAYFTGTLAADGQADATDGAADAVYAYRKSAHTRP